MTFRQKYEIIPRYLTGPSKRRPQLLADPIRFMVAHDTGNPGSIAANNVSYYERSRDEMEASAHIFVDDESIIECIPFLTSPAEKAWHVVYNVTTDNVRYGTNANDAAGGVELCYGGGIDLYEAYARYVWVLAYSCYRYGLNPAADITGHHILDPQRKVDPMNALKLLGKSFDDLVQDVIDEYNDCLEDEEDMAQIVKLPADIAENIISSHLSTSWFSCDKERQLAEQEGRLEDAAAWTQLRDWQKTLADSLRDAAGIPRE